MNTFAPPGFRLLAQAQVKAMGQDNLATGSDFKNKVHFESHRRARRWMRRGAAPRGCEPRALRFL